MIHVYRSNRMEALAEALAHVLDRPPEDPLEADHVVIPSSGMAQWLRLELAARRGVIAHVRWWQPRELVEHVLAGAHAVPEPAWARDRLAWSVLTELAAVEGLAGFEELAPWLAGAPDAAARMQLARRIAHTFDQYAVYRPELVASWGDGADDHWQARLWRRLEARLGAGHLAACVGRAIAAGPAPSGPDGVPPRLSLFGLTTLPPAFLGLLGWAAAEQELHLFQLAPTPAWWGDTSSDRQIRRLLRGRTPGGGPVAEAALHIERGHPLLAALGGVGRDFQALVEEAFDYVDDEVDRFVPSGVPTVLGVLQDDLLALRTRAPHERVPLPTGDATFRVLGAHSPVREVEVLRDELLALLRDDPTLRPRDVLVLMPDVTVHGPLIDAVFGVDPADPAWLPYVVADRPVATGSEVARAMLDLLALVGGRLAAPDVLDLLSLGAVRRRFGFTDDDPGALEALVREAGIRWGRDASHRVHEQQPEVEAHTWRFGLDRLLLGHATDADVPIAGRMPWAHVEGDGVRRVDRFVAFAEAVLGWVAALEAPRAPAAWAEALGAVLADLFAGDDERFEEQQQVEGVLAALADDAAAAGWEGEVPLALVRQHLEATLSSQRRQGAFLRGGITFCEMLPMRSVPARVVALLGLSDGAFPRSDAHLGFDLMRSARRRGDRSLRDDDRYLVLEALLSARDAVRVTYVSRSVNDNAVQPPSVVLADLLDALDATFEPPPGAQAARDVLRVEHPLQPFSVRYVTGHDRLRTFDRAHDAAARALLATPEPEPPFLEGPLPPAQPVREVDLDQLVRFLRDPVRWFQEQRLGVGQVAIDDALPDREPLDVVGLDRYRLGQRLLELRLRGLTWTACAEVVRAEGWLPVGQLAASVLGPLCLDVDLLLRDAGERLAAPALPPQIVELEAGPVRLTGRVDQLRACGRVEVSVRRIGAGAARHRIGPWVRHLALCASEAPVRTTEVFACRPATDDGVGAVIAFRAVAPQRARDLLADLVELYVEGHARPLPFLPDVSWRWVQGRAAGTAGAVDAARREAAGRWREADDPVEAEAWSRLVGGVEAFRLDREDPLGFTSVAERVLAPLVAHEEGA